VNFTRKIVSLVTLLCSVGLPLKAKELLVKGAVLSSEQAVEATTDNGRIRISYVAPTKRRYEWDGNTRVVKMIPRQVPFQRKLGLYNPSDSWMRNPLEVRLVVEESILNFENEGEMYAFLRQSSNYMKWVYTADGLVVGFGETPARNQVNIDLWQLLLRGKRPEALRGAKSDRIIIVR
jgi:hypothetical protein